MTESTQVLSVAVQRRFAAPRERVFGAWTEARAIKEWFGRNDGTDISDVDADVRVGGRFRIQYVAPQGEAAIVGTYREVVPVERLAFTFAWDPPVWDVMKGDDMLVTVDFVDVDGETDVLLTHERLEGPDVSAFHEEGWTLSLDGLERYLGEAEEG
jgi:uncharacterized protein YndB with AHSA1/START domain